MKYFHHPCRFDWEPFDNYTCGFYRDLHEMPYVCGKCHSYLPTKPVVIESVTESISGEHLVQNDMPSFPSDNNQNLSENGNGQNPYDQDMSVETNNISAISLSLNYNQYIPKVPSDFNTIDCTYMPNDCTLSGTINFSLINNETTFPFLLKPIDTNIFSLKRQNQDFMEETISKKFRFDNVPDVLNNFMNVPPMNKRKKNNFGVFGNKKMKHG